MDEAKIRLSPEEASLVLNADWILTKNAILLKVRELFAELQAENADWLKRSVVQLPEEVLASSAKISRGENYRGLPYLVLDQPKLFGKEDVFAVRSLFWWGHFFSTTLQLSGCYKQLYQESLIRSFSLLREQDFYIGIHPDPWEHHYGEDNYRSLHNYSRDEFDRILRSSSFIKLSKKISLEQWNEAGRNLSETFRQLINMLAA